MYGFSLYGAALKHSLHLSQAELATISSASFLAGMLSWAPGLIVDRFGPKCAIITGGLSSATALTFFWTVATKVIVVKRAWLVWTLSGFGMLLCLAMALVTGSVFKLIYSTTSPSTKGAAVGAAKGYVGLGAGAYAILFEALGRPNDLDCLLMIACFNLMAAALPAFLLLPSHADELQLQRPSNIQQRVDDLGEPHFRTIYTGLTGLGLIVIGQSIMSLFQDSDEREGADYIQFFLLWILWMGPVLSLLIHPRSVSAAQIAVDEEKQALVTLDASSHSAVGIAAGGVSVTSFHIESAPPTARSVIAESYPDVSKKTDELPVEGEPVSVVPVTAPVSNNVPGSLAAQSTQQHQYHLVEMLMTPEAWLLCWTCTILTGAGIVMTNNMGQMAESLHLHANVTPAALALFCAAQAFSRVVTGAASDYCLQKYSWARPTFLLFASGAAVISHVVLAFASHEVPFVIGVALSGVAFGMIWPLVVLIVGELFGPKHLGANYMFFDGFDSAIGTLLISKFIAETVYERNIVHHSGGKHGDETTCYGEKCFQTTHFIVVALSGSCILTCVCLLNTKLSKMAYAIPAVTKRKRQV
jgi:MFS family permease